MDSALADSFFDQWLKAHSAAIRSTNARATTCLYSRVGLTESRRQRLGGNGPRDDLDSGRMNRR